MHVGVKFTLINLRGQDCTFTLCLDEDTQKKKTVITPQPGDTMKAIVLKPD